jgi:hypothetical protein
MELTSLDGGTGLSRKKERSWRMAKITKKEKKRTSK